MWNVSLTSSEFVFEWIKRSLIGLEQEDAWQFCGTLHWHLIHPCHIFESCGERGYFLAILWPRLPLRINRALRFYA